MPRYREEKIKEEEIKEIPKDKSIAEILAQHTGEHPEKYQHDKDLPMPDPDELETVDPEETE